MDLRNASLDGRVLEIITEDEYVNKRQLFFNDPSMLNNMGLITEDKNGNKLVLPFRGKSDDRPGVYTDGAVYFLRYPIDPKTSQYGYDNVDIVDFSNCKSINDFIGKTEQVREMESYSLTDSDDIYVPQYNQKDTSSMKALKDAIGSKHIDIDKYAQRFGDNYLNNKRILRGEDITLKKIVEICEKLDIQVELSFRDPNPDVPNPMGKEIKTIVTNNDERGDEDSNE